MQNNKIIYSIEVDSKGRIVVPSEILNILGNSLILEFDKLNKNVNIKSKEII